ncbi:MAG: hypothetical protein CMA07_05975 [Euryarchaeota archaeon]|nr:hypothetical protein [Euryarchaeota archaeon]
MPMYTIVNKKTEGTQTVFCSYEKLQEKLEQLGEDWSQQIGAPALISTTGNIINKTSSDWKDHLKKIKKGSGSGTNIKT